jgi:hypothetical protein
MISRKISWFYVRPAAAARSLAHERFKPKPPPKQPVRFSSKQLINIAKPKTLTSPNHHPLCATTLIPCAAAPLHPSPPLRLSLYILRPCSSSSSPARPLAAPFLPASRVPRLFVQQHPAQLSCSSAYGKDEATRPRLV